MPDDVDITWDQSALAGILTDPLVMDQLMELGRKVADGARADAPHLTGEGAASIHAEPFPGPEVRVSWSRDRYYMRFQELGTVHLPARPFLVPALDKYL